MDASRLLQRLTVFPAALQTLCEGVADDDHSWRPEEGGWCLRELVAHLADEEGEDFRARLEFVLDEREGAFDPIDPEGWVAARRYRDRPVAQSLERFAAARVETLTRLRERLDAAGPRASTGPCTGPIRASRTCTRAISSGHSPPMTPSTCGSWRASCTPSRSEMRRPTRWGTPGDGERGPLAPARAERRGTESGGPLLSPGAVAAPFPRAGRLLGWPPVPLGSFRACAQPSSASASSPAAPPSNP